MTPVNKLVLEGLLASGQWVVLFTEVYDAKVFDGGKEVIDKLLKVFADKDYFTFFKDNEGVTIYTKHFLSFKITSQQGI